MLAMLLLGITKLLNLQPSNWIRCSEFRFQNSIPSTALLLMLASGYVIIQGLG
jgi:hypothetical protein